MFSFCFVHFLVFFWLILNVFALSRPTGVFLTLQYFLLPTCYVPFSLSFFAGLSLSGPLPIIFTIVV